MQMLRKMRVSDAEMFAVPAPLFSSLGTERTQVQWVQRGLKRAVESTIKYGLESWYEKTKLEDAYDTEP